MSCSLKLEPSGSKYKLTTAYVYKDVTVPKGYTTDGLSYKFRLIGIFLNKFDPRYIEAAVIHDWLVDNNEWDKANERFEELLPKGRVSKLMVYAVKLYKKLQFS